MNKLWKIEWDCGYGTLYGIFLATDEDVKSLVGNQIYMGEENGKHSEVDWVVEDGDIELFSDDEFASMERQPRESDGFLM